MVNVILMIMKWFPLENNIYVIKHFVLIFIFLNVLFGLLMSLLYMYNSNITYESQNNLADTSSEVRNNGFTTHQNRHNVLVKRSPHHLSLLQRIHIILNLNILRQSLFKATY